MTYVGVDLAAEAARTGLAVMADTATGCVIERVDVGADDDWIVGAIGDSTRAGIDVPLGWPEAFVALVGAHAQGALVAPESTDRDWRRTLSMRTTDLVVHRRTGITPLSVATDRIAHAALRWAGIEARLRDLGIDVSRSGSGLICEVYPAAALKVWSMPHRRYKGRGASSQRETLVSRVVEKFPELEWNGHRDQCVNDDNALDAVLAALVTREVELGKCESPPHHLYDTVLREGWIWVPALTPPDPALESDGGSRG